MKARIPQKTRRGVLLLVVLALLAMFGLFAIAFVVLSSQARRTSLQQQRIEQSYDPHEALLYQGLLQVLIGSDNVGSVLRDNGLLEDLYGNMSVEGTISGATTAAGGQLLSLTINGVADPEHRVGSVLTLLDGPAARTSLRIVGYSAGSFVVLLEGEYPVLGPNGVDGQGGGAPFASPGSDDVVRLGDRVLINGAAFSGTGFGYNPNWIDPNYNRDPASAYTNDPDPRLGPADQQCLLTASLQVPGRAPPSISIATRLRHGLLPNPVAFHWDVLWNLNYPGYTDPAGPGGANEDYDAPDYQNMLLARLDPALNFQVVAPSLHRPELINYWYNLLFNSPDEVAGFTWPGGSTDQQKWQAILQPNRYGGVNRDAILQFKRRFILRPMTDDHPNFNGGNPVSYPPLTGMSAADLRDKNWDIGGDWGSGSGGNLWDVDTDGDGIPDAIWVDLGFAPRSLPDGRKYKALFAIHCVDLDGRLNVNAHASLAQALRPYYPRVNPVPSTQVYGLVGMGGLMFADGTAGADFLSRGQGYGPAEVNLAPLFSSLIPSALEILFYQQLLVGGPAVPGVDGRYGESHLWAQNILPAPGRTLPFTVPLPLPPPSPPAPVLIFPLALSGPFDPRFDPRADPLGFNKYLDFPDDYLAAIVPGTASRYLQTSYGSIPDLKGSLALGLDPRGQPIYDLLNDGSVGAGATAFDYARTNHPYELNLSRKRDRGLPSPTLLDNPFSVAELERLFRPFDRDTFRLPTRLAMLTSPDPMGVFESILTRRRHEVTTESWSLPCPNVALNPSMLAAIKNTPGLSPNALNRPLHLIDLLVARGVPAAVIPQLAPLDFMAGRKMDLNRPLGNGRDDDGGTVVDEGMIPALGETDVYYYTDAGGTIQPVPFNYGFDVDPTSGLPVPITNGIWARQLFARHLYVLMLLVIDDNYFPPWIDPALPLPQRQVERARWLAQWAVNVVDFRDRDSIMTLFPYVVDPFTSGWNINNTSPVVWGCERPELLFTEATALHARRSEDLALDHFVDPSRNAPSETADLDFDQRLRPLGSLFVELMNPWTSADADSGEFCFDRAPFPPGLPAPQSQWRGGVLLNQRNRLGQPVWRILVVDGGAVGTQPPDPDDPTQAPPIPERYIYFVDFNDPQTIQNLPPPPAGEPPDVVRYGITDSNSTRIAPILHNRYAVIGPGDPNYGGVTWLSKGTEGIVDPTQYNTGIWRRIEIAPDVNPDAPNQVRVLRNDPNRDETNIGQVKPPVGVLVNQSINWDATNNRYQLDATPRRLSVSEPTAGYPAATWTPNVWGTFSDYLYPVVLDPPVDTDAALVLNGMTPRYRIIYLQRLANPVAPFDAAGNPYRTIDSMPVDLVAYNGWEMYPEPNVASNDTVVFRSRQRGDNPPAGMQRNLWRAEPWDRPTQADDPLDTPLDEGGVNPAPAPPLAHAFPRVFKHTLGYVNQPFWPFVTPTTPGLPPPVAWEYRGDPDTSRSPFPWFNWNNRPFVSEMELMLVPWARSSQVLAAYNVSPGAVNPYLHDQLDNTNLLQAPFTHLPSFFRTMDLGLNLPGSELFRLMELVYVPSRFVGTEIDGNPMGMAGSPFGAPFNRFPTYREPGRINLNTMNSQDVYRGLLNLPDLSDGGTWSAFVASRQGYAGPILNPQYPTTLARPFRSSAGANLVPIPELRVTVGSEVNSTLFRATEMMAPPQTPLLAMASASALNDTGRNPYFRFQEMQRLANSVGTHSNVYAVWITVGYFQVEPSGAVDAGHPDGYQLGAELGSDTGEVNRHRAFFILDRSIPVGFQRGKDHNVDKTILLKRYIE